MKREVHEREFLRLQTELVKLRESGTRLVVVFEGRDAAAKGSAIKRITEHLNPRVARIVALPAPSERERTQWYFQRYVAHLPAAGEIVRRDRGRYNRAGRVMDHCTPEEHRLFLRQCPAFERMLVEDGVLLRRYRFSVSDDEQERRFDEKRRARINMIAHLLGTIDYQEMTAPEITLPERPPSKGCERTARSLLRVVPGWAGELDDQRS